ncbi:oxygen-independent coproporphyrinogen III oxidase [Niastella sp. OAS944]|uniref:oxygen-independent coproporphyrinogen III oxidase n=1 Tax=Niastella sp. OAS944 TaxID=2664089 RepID=UPI00348719A7|nr:oxygen-independent coproporphyrinogen-3 oxidase [Chitinophagaceae bacterium OAS944]
MTIDPVLLHKYNVPVPRYTSYPTVPCWNEHIDASQWTSVFQQQFNEQNRRKGISLYLHLPFCESLCTYCGCNKKITTNHSIEDEYLHAIITEWKLYRQLMTEAPVIREMHLGGGTPTFFSPANLEKLIKAITNDAIIHPDHEFSIEGHPNNTTKQHMESLFQLSFRRISFGVQDNDPTVQRIINRIQPFENVQRVTEQARAIGFTAVNFDLIYGLPLQTLSSIEKSILQSLQLKPDRVAFYSYAHVPWTSRGQRLFDENDLPGAELKMQLYETGRRLFIDHGYSDIGMDHFALPGDALHTAWQQGTMHRNFMGYTTQHSGLLLGLGVSAISDAGIAFAQNHKTLHDYYKSLTSPNPILQSQSVGHYVGGDSHSSLIVPVTKGYFLTQEDEAFKAYILDVICRGTTTFHAEHMPLLKQYTFPELALLEADELITWDEKRLQVTERGRHFLRNICKAFDLHLLRKESTSKNPQYSKAI